MFKCSGCCDCFKKGEEPELDTGYKIDETQQKILVDNKQLKHKIYLTVDKKTYTFYMTDKALKQLYEKKQKFLEDIKEGEKNFYNFSIDCFKRQVSFDLCNDEFIILSEDNDYLKKTNNRLSVYYNPSDTENDKNYLLEINEFRNGGKIVKEDVLLSSDLCKSFFEEIDNEYLKPDDGKKINEEEIDNEKVNKDEEEKKTKIDNEKVDKKIIPLRIEDEEESFKQKTGNYATNIFNAKPFSDTGNMFRVERNVEVEKIINDELNENFRFSLSFGRYNKIEYVLWPQLLLILYSMIMINKSDKLERGFKVVLNLAGASTSLWKEYLVYYVAGKFNKQIEGYEELNSIPPCLVINFDGFCRIEGITHYSAVDEQGVFEKIQLNNVDTSDVGHLNRLIFEKGKQLYEQQQQKGSKIGAWSGDFLAHEEPILRGEIPLPLFFPNQNSNNNNDNAENNLNKNIPQYNNIEMNNTDNNIITNLNNNNNNNKNIPQLGDSGNS